MHSSYADFVDEEESDTVTEEVAGSLNEILTRTRIPQLSSREQFNLADIIECVGTVEKHQRSIDDNASRFLLFWRQHVLRTGHTAEGVPISWREIVWAYHSGSQDILVDLVSRHFQNRMTWQHAKECGMFMWMTDLTALVRCIDCFMWLQLTPYSEPSSKSLPATSTPNPKTRIQWTAVYTISP